MESIMPLLVMALIAFIALAAFTNCFSYGNRRIGNGEKYEIPRNEDGSPRRPAPPNPMPVSSGSLFADLMLATGRYDLVESGDRITIVRKSD